MSFETLREALDKLDSYYKKEIVYLFDHITVEVHNNEDDLEYLRRTISLNKIFGYYVDQSDCNLENGKFTFIFNLLDEIWPSTLDQFKRSKLNRMSFPEWRCIWGCGLYTIKKSERVFEDMDTWLCNVCKKHFSSEFEKKETYDKYLAITEENNKKEIEDLIKFCNNPLPLEYTIRLDTERSVVFKFSECI